MVEKHNTLKFILLDMLLDEYMLIDEYFFPVERFLPGKKLHFAFITSSTSFELLSFAFGE